MNMTREEIQAMPAGAELDEMVAVTVLKLKRYEHDFTDPEYCSKCRRTRDAHSGRIYPDGNNDCNLPDEYSTDISAAWEVVERLHELGWSLTLDDMRHDKDNSGWWWELCRYEGAQLPDVEHEFPTHYWKLDGLADTAPLAICRAALLAVTNPP